MFHELKHYFKKRIRGRYNPIDPDEIFLDSKNLPEFDTNQFEGRIEKPIGRNVFGAIAIFIFFICLLFVGKLWALQITQGEVFLDKSENNRLRNTTVYADRGVIYDRNGVQLVWNTLNPESSDFSIRQYATSTGLSTLLGYIKYPTKDSSGVYYQKKFDPKDGIEKIYDTALSGINGTKMTETDVRGNVTSESVVQPPVDGKNISLSIDAKLQKKLYAAMLDIADRAGYKGGAGLIMNLHTGEILASSNFPEYDSQTMTDGSDAEKINGWINSKNNPFLNRAIDGLYTPGSIVKPFVAMGVLDQGVIDPKKQILSTGSISIPNPYTPSKPSVFMDWKAHGLVDLRHALAVSSNVYFYEVGGGFQNQKGIGIANIEKYVRMFALGTTTGINFPGEKKGTIPDPEWKKMTFGGEDWRIGDTYNTAIGQYGFQVSPIQVVRAVAALANGGTLLTPTLLKDAPLQTVGHIDLNPDYYTIVKEGMRLCVTEGTCHALNEPFLKVGAKTGTAQIGVAKDEVNSWVIGFWPYENPQYAFALVMERGSKDNQFGSVLVFQEVFDWMGLYAPEYLN
ncbi:MAG: penicillin-binding transpeptidase domain-containing protein [Patescibacteria group bacterium]